MEPPAGKEEVLAGLDFSGSLDIPGRMGRAGNFIGNCSYSPWSGRQATPKPGL